MQYNHMWTPQRRFVFVILARSLGTKLVGGQHVGCCTQQYRFELFYVRMRTYRYTLRDIYTSMTLRPMHVVRTVHFELWRSVRTTNDSTIV